jgi:methylated-DNA-[protein]-cysteine S-methyltransferase
MHAENGSLGSRFYLGYHVHMDYQAILAAPFGKLGIRCTDDVLLGIAFLPTNTKPSTPRSALAKQVCAQLEAYLSDAAYHFDLPLKLDGTEHQRKVWQSMCAIPCGQTLNYGELAKRIGSSAQAVGQACGSNPIPVVIPCHRVVGKNGLGGFMQHAEGESLDIKRWLLDHERVL